MKHVIAWHTENLKNINSFMREISAEVTAAQRKADRIFGEIRFLEMQLNEAARRGLTEFDEEKFLLKHKDDPIITITVGNDGVTADNHIYNIFHDANLNGIDVMCASNIPHVDEACDWCKDLRDRVQSRIGERPE